ncbi:MAG: tetratricopeptide repeat protein [Bacteroidia bacterium]|nr:tetratricopeptide repeat protein [Bacteroidia bacterium]
MKQELPNTGLIKKYINRQLSPEETDAFEKKLTDDPFLADAVEGYKKFPSAINDIDPMKKDFRTKVSGSKTIFSSGIFVAVFSVVVLSAAFVLLYFLVFRENPLSQNHELINKTISVHKKETIPVKILSDNEIKEARVIEKEKQITYRVALKNQPETVVENKSENTTVNSISSKPVYNVSDENKSLNRDNIIGNSKIVRSNFPITYILDLKVADYTKMHRTRIKLSGNSGVDAKFENRESSSSGSKENETGDIPYIKFLGDALQKFVGSDYKSALKDFNIILSRYSDDLNALFYGGLCLYNLQKHDKAIEFFDKAIDSDITTFYQEAKWYKALSLQQKEDIESAKKLLKEIISEEGFYAERAGQKLKQVEK